MTPQDDLYSNVAIVNRSLANFANLDPEARTAILREAEALINNPNLLTTIKDNMRYARDQALAGTGEG